MLRAVSRIPRNTKISVSSARRWISESSSEVFTKINDTNDPARNQFFQYTWGSWMKDDKTQRAKRETRFSIEGVSEFFKSLKQKEAATIAKPEALDNGMVILPNNWTEEVIGSSGFDVKSIASIHEGKHHRIYKLTLVSGKEFVLRIPYKLESDFAIDNKIKSEVATLDFLSVKLGASVPKVLAYGVNRLNPLKTPFILMEYVDGDLLMKQWDPLMPDGEETEQKLKSVIEPIVEFQDKLLEITFNRIGSLYFFDDVSVENQSVIPYDESDETLKNRWRIGPSVERIFSKNKSHLSSGPIRRFNGPWDADKPEKMVEDIASLELESLKARLALAQADASGQVEDISELKKQIQTFENFKTMSSKLFNPKSPSIMNVGELFKPRLYVPDLDPLNVIVDSKSSKPVFFDLEYSTIKPFLLAAYPSFVAYQGAKIFNLQEDIPGFDEMDDVEKQQYLFMFYKTRNERLWELALNAKRHDLIAVASPHVKVLKAPYLQLLECKNDKDYMFVENAIVQLQTMWDTYVANQLCNGTEEAFPVAYTPEYLDEHKADLEAYQIEVASTPFAATGGWVPQDMFTVLKEQGILVEDGDGNYRIETEAALKTSESMEEEAQAKEAKEAKAKSEEK